MKATCVQRAPRILAALACVVALAGCNELLRGRIQSEIDKIWGIPSRKAAMEDTLEAKVKEAVEKDLKGEYFEVPGPNPYLHHLKSASVWIGSKQPVVDVPGKVKFWQTDANYYLQLDWEAGWVRDNGAGINLGLDLRTRKWWLANEYPDHTVKIRKIGAEGNGTILVIKPKSGAKATASMSVAEMTIDLKAEAEGWFWTVDISKQIKKQVNNQVVRRLIGKSVEYAFDANIPGI